MEFAGRAREFGLLPNGGAVEAVTIASGPLQADILTWGAVVRDLRHEARPHPLVLGCDGLEDYLVHSRYFGATAGRYANRIANARFTLDGRKYQLERNSQGLHHLHGGRETSFARKLWTIEEAAPDGVTLRLVSKDGEGGYPGRVEVTCRYEIVAPSTLRIAYAGTTDAPTLLNLAHHGYFNLDGASDILGHRLQLAAETYLPVDDAAIPIGKPVAVAGTGFDFREERPIGDASQAPTRYDHNFCLALARAAQPQFAARLTGSDGGLAMEVWTTEPGLQFYDGHKLDVPVAGLDGRRYGPRAGLCLEPQVWPDSPNRPDFPSAVLRPGEIYRQVTELRLSA